MSFAEALDEMPSVLCADPDIDVDGKCFLWMGNQSQTCNILNMTMIVTGKHEDTAHAHHWTEFYPKTPSGSMAHGSKNFDALL